MFERRMRCLPEAAEGLKATAQDGLRWFDARLTARWIVGDQFTLADVLLFAFVDFGVRIAGQPPTPELHALLGWYARVERHLAGA
jgi:glutathione S-transferase